MKLQRRKGTVIIIQDSDDKGVLDVIFSPVEMESNDARIEALVQCACFENSTSTDDVTWEISKILYQTKDNRCPIVKYEFNPRATRRSTTSPRGSSHATASTVAKGAGSATARPTCTREPAGRANTSKTSRPRTTKTKRRNKMLVDVQFPGKSKL